MTAKLPAVVFNESLWRKSIEHKCVDFSTDDLDKAVSGNGIIGECYVCGLKVIAAVDMYYRHPSKD